MSLLRQCQSHRFLISQTETSQMNTFPVLHAIIVNVKLPSQSKLLGHFCVFLSPQCWCTRFGDWTAINNFERDKGSTRRKKTAFGLSVPTIFVWDCKCRWIDLEWENLYLLACRLICWNNLNLLLSMEQMFYFCEYFTSLWLLWQSETLWLTS